MSNKIKIFLRYCGFYPDQFNKNIKGLGFWLRDKRKVKNLMKIENNNDFHFQIRPQLLDRFDNAGVMEGAYFNQDLLIAQKIFTNNPINHIDIGSRIDGFVAHVASFRKIKVFDIRKIESNFQNIEFEKRDIMNFYPDLENSCDSISSLHAIEHFGLGRYGDPINLNGHKIAIDNIYRYLKKGGTFYFSVPIGKKQRIEFNAHRVFSLSYLLGIFNDCYELKTFSYVDDSGILYRDIELLPDDINNTFNLHYGCGIFELIKK
jgi:SAM-dependent methyltransferase